MTKIHFQRLHTLSIQKHIIISYFPSFIILNLENCKISKCNMRALFCLICTQPSEFLCSLTSFQDNVMY